jgi:hypothetical protein
VGHDGRASAFSVGRHRQVDVAFLVSIGDTIAGGRFVPPVGGAWLYGAEQRTLLLDLALDALVLDTARR